MELRDLKVFLAVVETRGFTAAGERVHLVQSAVSDAIARLERELGVPLLERRRGGSAATSAGAALVPWARLLLNSAERAGREVGAYRNLDAGSISIGLLPTITPLVLPALLGRLRAAYPALAVRVHEGLSPDLLDRLRTAELDLTVLFFPAEPVPEVSFVEVATRPLSVIVAPDHPLANHRSLRLAAAASQRWVTFPPHNPGRIWLEEACRRAGFSPLVAAEVETTTQQQIFVEAGIGVAMVPFGPAQARRAGGLVRALRLQSPSPGFKIGYAFHPGIPNPALGAVREVIEDVLLGHQETRAAADASPP